MNRRSFVVAAVAAALPFRRVDAESRGEEAASQCRFHRYDRESDSWRRIEYEAIRSGDVVWAKSDTVSDVVLVSRGYEASDDLILVSHFIDPETNEWVPPSEYYRRREVALK